MVVIITAQNSKQLTILLMLANLYSLFELKLVPIKKIGIISPTHEKNGSSLFIIDMESGLLKTYNSSPIGNKRKDSGIINAQTLKGQVRTMERL